MVTHHELAENGSDLAEAIMYGHGYVTVEVPMFFSSTLKSGNIYKVTLVPKRNFVGRGLQNISATTLPTCWIVVKRSAVAI